MQREKLTMTLHPTFRTVQLDSIGNNIRTFRKSLQVIEMVTMVWYNNITYIHANTQLTTIITLFYLR